MTVKGQSQKSSSAADNAEKQLWASVITQALADAVVPRTERSTHEIDRARRWLTVPNKDFDLVCELAGLEPWQVRAYAESEIAKANTTPRKLRQRHGGRPGVGPNFAQTEGDQFPPTAREIA
jgi:hypothetical protein